MDLTASTYALVGAATTSSYVLFSNVGLIQLGPIALLRGRVADVKLSPADKVRLWAGYFFPASRWSVGGTLAGLALDIFVNRTHPSPFIAKLSLASGLIGASVIPFTLTFLRETNAELIATSRDEAKLAAVTDDRVDALIQKWERFHLIRMVAMAGAWACAMTALVWDSTVFVGVSEVVVA